MLWLDSPFYSIIGHAEYLLFLFAFFVWLYQLFANSQVCWKSLSIIFLLYSTTNSLYSLPHFPTQPKGNSLTVVNFNVHVFNSYSNFKAPDLKTTTETIDWVNNVEADVLCLQEFYNIPKSKKVNVLPLLKEKYPRHYYDISSKNGAGNTYGSIVFSKFPIIYYEELKEDKAVNGSFFIDILKDKDTIRIYACHLQSNKYNEAQIEAISTSEGKKTFLGKYLETAKIRIEQAKRIIDNTNQCPYPFIICGDFNDTPISIVYKKMKKNFTDSFLEAGSGYGSTFHHKKLPDIRIDYQFHSNDFICNTLRVAKEMSHSDHYPLIGVYSLKKQSN